MIKIYKPVDTARIEAMLFRADTEDPASEWANGDVEMRITARDNEGFDTWAWQVKTLEGWVDMPYGSYLIKGTNNEFYPCDPDVFEKRWVETKPTPEKGCGRQLAPGNWWNYCGETDMGQTAPAICEECSPGGFPLKTKPAPTNESR